MPHENPRHPQHHRRFFFRWRASISRPDAALAHGHDADGRWRRHSRYRRGVVQSRRQSRLRPTSRSPAWPPSCPALQQKRRVAFHRQLLDPRCSAGRWRRASTISTTFTALPIRALSRPGGGQGQADRDACGAGTRASPPAPMSRRRRSSTASLRFFEQRLEALTEAGIAPRPADPGPRHGLLRGQRSGELPDRAAPPAGPESPFRPAAAGLGLAQIFPGKITGRPPAEAGRAPAWPPNCLPLAKGADYIRTHAPGPLQGRL